MADNLSLGIKIGASVAPSVGRAFQTVEDKAQSVGKTLRETWSKRDTAANVIHYRNQLQQLREKQASLGHSSERLDRGIAEVERRYADAKSQAKEYGLSVGNIVQEHRHLADSAQVAERRMDRLQTMQANRDQREELQGQVMGTAGAALAAAAPIRAAAQFEEKMADIKKVVEFDKPEQFEALGQDILRMSANMPMAAEGIADIVAAAGQSGIAKDQLQDFAESAVKMGTAFDISGRKAGKMMSSWRAGMGLTQDQTESLADSINHLSNNMNAEAAQLAKVVQREGATAKAAGLAATETAALGAALLAPGTSAERSATALKKLTSSLTAGSAATARQREGFQKLGMDAQTLAQRMQKDAQGTITEVFDRINSMDKAEQGALIKQIFGQESKSAIMPLLGQLDELKKAQGMVADETQYAGSMTGEYQERVETTTAQMGMFRSQINRLGVNLGSALLPALNAVMGGVGGLVGVISHVAEQLPVVTQLVVGTGVALVGFKVAALAGRYAATFLSDGVQIAKAGMDFFRLSTLRTTGALWLYRVRMVSATAATKALALGGGIKAGLASLTGYLGALGRKPLSLRVGVMALGSSLTWLATSALPVVVTSIKAASAAFLTSPIGWIAGGIAAGALLIYKLWKPLGAFFSGLWDGISTGVGAVLNELQPLAPLGRAVASVFGWLGDVIGTAVGWITSLLAPVGKTKAEFQGMTQAGRAVGRVIGFVFYLALTPIRLVSEAIAWVASGFTRAGQVMQAVFGGISAVVSGVWNVLTSVLSWSPLGLVARAWEPLVSWFGQLGSGIQNVLGGMWQWVKDQIMAPIDAVMDKVGSAWETVKGWFGGGEEEKTVKVREKVETARSRAGRVGRTVAAGAAAGASAAAPAASPPSLAGPPSQPAPQPVKEEKVTNMGDVTLQISGNDPEEIAQRVREELEQMNHRVNADG